jgi:hypothetical protein
MEGVPWSYIQIEIDHHVEELDLIRNTQDSSLQALCFIYCYIRDGAAGSWYSTSLQYKWNTSLYCQASGLCTPGSLTSGFPGTPADDPTQQGAAACTYCGTILHRGGKSSCPWKNQSKKQSKRLGNAALQMLIREGLCPNLNSSHSSNSD